MLIHSSLAWFMERIDTVLFILGLGLLVSMMKMGMTTESESNSIGPIYEPTLKTQKMLTTPKSVKTTISLKTPNNAVQPDKHKKLNSTEIFLGVFSAYEGNQLELLNSELIRTTLIQTWFSDNTIKNKKLVIHTKLPITGGIYKKNKNYAAFFKTKTESSVLDQTLKTFKWALETYPQVKVFVWVGTWNDDTVRSKMCVRRRKLVIFGISFDQKSKLPKLHIRLALLAHFLGRFCNFQLCPKMIKFRIRTPIFERTVDLKLGRSSNRFTITPEFIFFRRIWLNI